MITEIETALVDLLRLELGPAGLKVEAFPEKPEEYALTHPIGVVLVVFRGSDFGEPRPTDRIVQAHLLTWEIVFLVRNLRTHLGAYPILDTARQSLTGWKAPNCRAGHVKGIHFQHQAAGVWQYALTYATPTTSVEVVPDPTPRAGAVQLTVEAFP